MMRLLCCLAAAMLFAAGGAAEAAAVHALGVGAREAAAGGTDTVLQSVRRDGSVPESTHVALLGTGLLGAAMVMRLRFRS